MSARPSMNFPIRINASEALKVDVHLHQIFLGDRQRQCWTYITTGLVIHQQRELMLTLLLEDDDQADGFPKTPIKIFQLLEKSASDGKIMTIADATKLGKIGLFGFNALFYLPAIQYTQLPDATQHLALMLVHQSEYEFARKYGFTRLLSRIGKFCSSFPYPTWNTRMRPSVFGNRPNLQEPSLLNEFRSPSSLVAVTVLDKGIVSISVRREDQTLLAQKLEELGANDQSFLLQTILTEDANACLYWEPSQVHSGAYTEPDQATKIGAAFVVFRSSPVSFGQLTEDGFTFSLSASAISKIRDACLDGTELLIPDLIGFKLRFTTIEEDEFHTQARNYQHVAAWTGVTTPSDKARLNSVSSGAIKGSTIADDKALTEHVSAIQQFLLGSLADESEQFMLTITLSSDDQSSSYDITADTDLNEEFADFIKTGLENIPPYRSNGPTTITMEFQVNS
ncbi:MAG: DUF3480 domain-containing protein [Pseudomonadales bacterium]